MDSFSLEYPSSWTYKLQAAPDGSYLHMFMGPQDRNAMPYCHATQQPLDQSIAPRAAKMNVQQRREFFLASSNQDLLFSLYNNLASAKGFQLIYANAAAIGQATPAFMADFVFSVPQGFAYRVRSHYTFWPKGQFSLWCQATSRNEAAAEDTFLRHLAIFQKVAASVKIVE